MHEICENFIKRAENYVTFNFCPKSTFRSTQYKKEVQYLITKHWFPGFGDFCDDELNLHDLQNKINILKSINLEGFNKLFTYAAKGIGDGEVLLYYLYNNATIQGGSSAGIDIILNSTPFEIKAAKTQHGKNGYDHTFIYDFRLGGTIPLTSLINKIQYKLNTTSTEICGSLMEDLKNKDPIFYEEMESMFRDIVEDYFCSHDMIIFSKNKQSFGDIIHLPQITRDMIYMERLTSNTIKPMIRVDVK